MGTRDKIIKAMIENIEDADLIGGAADEIRARSYLVLKELGVSDCEGRLYDEDDDPILAIIIAELRAL